MRGAGGARRSVSLARGESELLEQVERRVDRVNTRFAEELGEYQSNAKLALSLTESSTRFQQALAEGDWERAERTVNRLAEVYKYRVILAADREGAVLASGNAPRGPKSLARTRARSSQSCSQGSRYSA